MIRLSALFIALFTTVLLATPTQAHAFTPVANTRFVNGATDGPVIYYGGPLLTSVKIYAVFWGAKVNANTQTKMGAFYTALTDSDYLDFLNQYSTPTIKIGRGTYVGSTVIKPKNVAKHLMQADVEAELLNQIDNGTLAKPDANSLYIIHFPPGIVINAFGGDSCQTWCGDHEAIKNNPKYGNIAYAMIPDLGGACSFGCYADGTPLGSMTIVTSHEIAEAITDPVSPGVNEPNAFPAGWISAGQAEIGDLCVGGKSTLNTTSGNYTIQNEWDNSKNNCKSGSFKSAK